MSNNGEEYVTLSGLKKEYHFTQKWIERLGEPDITKYNPHFRTGPRMRLWGRDRILAFISEHSTEYDKRCKAVENRKKTPILTMNEGVRLAEVRQQAAQRGLTNLSQPRKSARRGEKCRRCKQKMVGTGCTLSHLTINYERIERLKYGESEGDTATNCPDCGAKKGGYHHDHCNWELCPVCGQQLFGFYCDNCDVEYPGTMWAFPSDVDGMAAALKERLSDDELQLLQKKIAPGE